MRLISQSSIQFGKFSGISSGGDAIRITRNTPHITRLQAEIMAPHIVKQLKKKLLPIDFNAKHRRKSGHKKIDKVSIKSISRETE